MFECKRTLFVAVALDARGIGTNRQFSLLRLKPAVCVVTVAAFHRPFEDLMMKRLGELSLGLGMTADTQLRLALFEQGDSCDSGVLNSGLTDLRYRTWPVIRERSMRTMAIGTADVIAPVFAAAEVIMALFAGVASKTGL